MGKSHREGISKKNGKPYNMHTLHCAGNARDVEGQAVLNITLSGNDFPYDKLNIGNEYIAEYDSEGKLLDFHAVTR